MPCSWTRHSGNTRLVRTLMTVGLMAAERTPWEDTKVMTLSPTTTAPPLQSVQGLRKVGWGGRHKGGYALHPTFPKGQPVGCHWQAPRGGNTSDSP